MKLIRERNGSVKIALFVGLSFLIFAIAVEHISIIRMNSGFFTYTLDDPYIHLALAENITGGHYGVNANEFSAPSSSILWPFILALFSFTSYFVYVPLLLNVIASMVIVFLFYKILDRCLGNIDIRDKRVISSFSVVLLILATNIVGLVFTGMEHSFQVLSVVLILYGLFLEIETKKVAPWLIAAIVIAPLIRYENLAVSCAAIFFLAFRKHYKYSLFLIVILVLFIGTFSIFLLHLGLEPLPTSVIFKSSVISNGGNPLILLRHFFLDQRDMAHALTNSGGGSMTLILSCVLLSLIAYVSFSKNKDGKRLLAGAISFSITLHLLFGENGWFFRYEIYIWTVAVLTLIYVFGETLIRKDSDRTSNTHTKRILMMVTLSVFIICTEYISALFIIRVASNNIYQQHFQMHRFAVDYYDKPIAVGDLGYVSFQNDNYVLDLVGLASIKALNYRSSGNTADWMNILAEENGVRFAMIYENSFPNIPQNWIKIGELRLGRQRITPFGSAVSFYAIGEESFIETRGIVREFAASLPGGVAFVYCE